MARKQSFTVRCDGDGCKEFVDVETANQLPENWYTVAIADAAGRPKQAFDFHDLRCVEKWSKARRLALGPDASDRYARTKDCPYCDEKFSPQGLTLHVRNNHPTEYARDNPTT